MSYEQQWFIHWNLTTEISLYSKILVEKMFRIFLIFQNYCEKKFPVFLRFQNSCRKNSTYIFYIAKCFSIKFSLYSLYDKILVEKIFILFLYSKILVEIIFLIFFIFQNSYWQSFPYLPHIPKFFSIKSSFFVCRTRK